MSSGAQARWSWGRSQVLTPSHPRGTSTQDTLTATELQGHHRAPPDKGTPTAHAVPTPAEAAGICLQVTGGSRLQHVPGSLSAGSSSPRCPLLREGFCHPSTRGPCHHLMPLSGIFLHRVPLSVCMQLLCASGQELCLQDCGIPSSYTGSPRWPHICYRGPQKIIVQSRNPVCGHCCVSSPITH